MKCVKKMDMRVLAIIVFAIAVLLYGWLSDDSYHAFVMARNLADGKGFVYNAGYRVNVSTCPLYTLLTTVFYLVINRNMYIAGMVQGVFFSVAAVYILLYRINKSGKNYLFFLLCLVGCYEFMCFTTSGLENSLLFFLSGSFLTLFFEQAEWSRKRLFLLFLVHSLILVTRMDNTLLYIVAIIYVFFFKCNIPYIERFFIALTGSSTFIIWELFSIWYYGLPFPNTMYIKLFTNLSKGEYFAKGIDYLWLSYICDGFMFFVIFAYIVIALRGKQSKHLCVLSGIIIYHIYIMYIGGDFMLGRFLTVPYFVSLCGLCDAYTSAGVAFKLDDLIKIKNEKIGLMALICLIGSLWRVFISPFAMLQLFEKHWDPSVTSVADERSYYSPVTGLFSVVMDNNWSFQSAIKTHYGKFVREIDIAVKDNCAGLIVEEWLGGMVKYYFVDNDIDIMLDDPFGLMDPLLARLPARNESVWRTGHMIRDIPVGYRESLELGRNVVEDEDLKQYYDVLLEITSGNLFSVDRIHTIINFNMGEYEYLKNRYLERNARKSPQR